MSKDEESKRTKYEVPKATGKDRALTIVRALTSAVPYIGGPMAELANLVSSPLEKRREAWVKDVTDGLHRLEEKVTGFDLENLEGQRYVRVGHCASVAGGLTNP